MRGEEKRVGRQGRGGGWKFVCRETHQKHQNNDLMTCRDSCNEEGCVREANLGRRSRCREASSIRPGSAERGRGIASCIRFLLVSSDRAEIHRVSPAKMSD
jgi:hypothetical protein